MAKQNINNDLILNNEIMEVCKFERQSGEFVGMKLMKYEEWKKMKKQSGFVYRAFQKNFSQFHLK
jgi:hypothetical protein